MSETNIKKTWKQDPKTVKTNILNIARKEIVKHGLAGSSINEIAQKSDTSKRMIYYYFKDKEGLYKAVLESTYESIRNSEKKIEVDKLNPIEALEKLIKFTIKHHMSNPDFIRLIMIENIHDSKYMKESEIIKELNAPAINRIEQIYEKGLNSGDFRTGLNPIEIHWQISALSFFNVSNNSSFSTAFGKELNSKESKKIHEKNIQDSIMRFVLKEEKIKEYMLKS